MSTKIKILLPLLTLLLCSGVAGAMERGEERPSMQEWLAEVKAVSEKYDMDPNDMLAVAQAEGEKNGYRWYFGRVGRYYLPWGIHGYVIKERGWNVRDWRVQTEVAIRALAHHRRKRGGLLSGLRSYNKSCTSAYINRVVSLAKRNKQAKVFDFNLP
jgi:hypothetical protein